MRRCGLERSVRSHSGAGRAARAAAAVALLWSLPAAADDVAGQITASTGLVEAPDDGAIGDGEHIQIGEDGGCSILVDQDAVVELCGESSMRLGREGRKRIVELDRGEIRVVVEPRDIESRVEIHTPAAIATLLGTIVHVAVDERTGKTTISSAQSRISVRSSDPDVRGTTVIHTAEQVEVTPGLAPPAKPRRLTREQIAALGGCLVDFHSAALGRDSREHGDRVMERLALVDRDSAAPDAGPPPPGAPGEEPPSNEGVCVATDCSDEIMGEIRGQQLQLQLGL